LEGGYYTPAEDSTLTSIGFGKFIEHWALKIQPSIASLMLRKEGEGYWSETAINGGKRYSSPKPRIALQMAIRDSINPELEKTRWKVSFRSRPDRRLIRLIKAVLAHGEVNIVLTGINTTEVLNGKGHKMSEGSISDLPGIMNTILKEPSLFKISSGGFR